MFSMKYAKRWLAIFAIAALMIAAYFYKDHATIRPDGNADNTVAARSNLDPIVAPDKISSLPAKKLWVCPMHPQIIQDHPGTCPICGMDLVEMEQLDAAHQHEHGHSIFIDTATQQKLGVRLAAAKMQTLSQDIHTYGNVAADESLVFNLSAKVEGVIRKLHINSVGQQVAAGQVLYEIYSPELLKSQEEYIDLLEEKDILVAPMEDEKAHASGKSTMSEDDMMALKMNAAKRVLVRDSLLYADVGNELIDELNKNYKSKDTVEIRAPQFGLVTSIEVHEGSTVKPMDKLFSFVNLSRVWVEIPLYPDQLFWVKNGDEATIRLPAGIREIKTKLKLIAPMVDNTTRTVLARLNVDNANSMLPLGSFLDVIIHAKPHKALVVPRSAVMRTGKGDLVMLAEGNGHFTPVNVETGIENSDTVEITSGLQAGDQVAVNGQFLLDAAASMSDTAQRLHNNHDANEH